MSSEPLPPRLKEAVSEDLAPVRPLGPSWRRALAVVPCLVVAGVIIALSGIRGDVDAMGPWLSWGASALLVAIAIGGFVLLARESVPGSGVPLSMILAGAAIAGVIEFAFARSVHQATPNPAPANQTVQMVGACFVAIVLFAAPCVFVGAVMVRRALPARPAMCGALAGAAGTIGAEGLWRLHCPFTDAGHFAFGHVLPAVVFAVAAMLLFRRFARPRGEVS